MLPITIIVIGLSGFIAQILLLREFLVVFHGSELSIGIIFANWLVLESIGAFFIGRKIEFAKNKTRIFILTNIIFSLLFPLQVYLTRIFKTLIGILPGEVVSIPIIFWSTFFILFPISITHGALFTFGCKLYDEIINDPSSSVGKTYIWETIGTASGGIIFTYLFIPFLNSFQTAIYISGINFLISGILAKKRNLSLETKLSIGLTILSLITIFTDIPKLLHYSSIKTQWNNQNVVEYQNSIYGNITVLKTAEQYTFFYNGIPTITAPYPDIIFNEEIIHFVLSLHPEPKNVLYISGAAGGKIFELLKYNSVETIDYVELDPLLLELVKKFPTELTKSELNNPKVNIYNTDGRLFTKITPKKYDIIFVGVSEILDLNSNRFHTIEFYTGLKNILSPTGIVCTTLPGSLTYISPQLGKLNMCIISTLNKIFPFIRLIPGDYNIILSSNYEIHLDAEKIYQMVKKRKISTSFLTLQYLQYRLHQRWYNWFLNSVNDIKSYLNYDYIPMGMFYGLSYWSKKFSPGIENVLKFIEHIKLSYVIIFVILIFFKLLFITTFFSKKVKLPVFYTISSTGFTSMVLDLALIFSFQTLYGYVYTHIALLTSAFMIGIILGSMWTTRNVHKFKNHFSLLIKLDVLILFFVIILIPVLKLFQEISHKPEWVVVLPYIFLILCFISGFLTGAEFPLANRIYLTTTQNLSFVAGTLYSADLIGGWLGGIAGSIVLLPILGIFNTCIFLFTLKLTSIILLNSSLVRVE